MGARRLRRPPSAGRELVVGDSVPEERRRPDPQRARRLAGKRGGANPDRISVQREHNRSLSDRRLQRRRREQRSAESAQLRHQAARRQPVGVHQRAVYGGRFPEARLHRHLAAQRLLRPALQDVRPVAVQELRARVGGRDEDPVPRRGVQSAEQRQPRSSERQHGAGDVRAVDSIVSRTGDSVRIEVDLLNIVLVESAFRRTESAFRRTCGAGLKPCGVRCALAIAVAATLFTTSCRPAPPPHTPASIILITIDTLRADHVSARLTPSLIALSRDAVVFDNVFTSAPLTLPAHASLLTALYPPRHRIHDNHVAALAAETPAFPPRLKSAGYATAAFVSAIVLDHRYGLNRGFD